MAALRVKSQNLYRYLAHPNPINFPAQLIFCRGIASQLFVKGLSFSTTEEGLAEAFSKFGEVTEAKVIMDKVRNRSKGYGYVTFAKADEAQQALIDMDGKPLDGRVLFVDNVRPSRNFNSGAPIARGPPEPASES